MFAEPLRCGGAVFDGSRTYVMGVVNATPDSFSDGGAYDPLERGRALAAAGADLIDVGGESTRPYGAVPVDAATEQARVVPVIEQLAREVAAPVSIDTYKAATAEAAIAAGAALVNDVTGGSDPALFAVCARARVPLVVGHWRREGGHADVFEEVCHDLARALARARAAGVAQVIADPGLGFGKGTRENLVLLARAGELSARLGVPVMVGPSRKRFLGELTGRPVGERLAPSLGAAVAAAMRGADFVRMHDVAEARAALTVADAVRGAA